MNNNNSTQSEMLLKCIDMEWADRREVRMQSWRTIDMSLKILVCILGIQLINNNMNSNDEGMSSSVPQISQQQDIKTSPVLLIVQQEIKSSIPQKTELSEKKSFDKKGNMLETLLKAGWIILGCSSLVGALVCISHRWREALILNIVWGFEDEIPYESDSREGAIILTTNNYKCYTLFELFQKFDSDITQKNTQRSQNGPKYIYVTHVLSKIPFLNNNEKIKHIILSYFMPFLLFVFRKISLFSKVSFLLIVYHIIFLALSLWMLMQPLKSIKLLFGYIFITLIIMVLFESYHIFCKRHWLHCQQRKYGKII